MTKLTMSKVEQTLTWAYKQALSSHGPIDGAIELAKSYQDRHSCPRRDANALIQWQTAKAAGLGFVTGVPGLPAMPVTLPANLTSVLFIQIRMIAAIAHLGGYDLNDDRVKTLCLACLCGNAARTILREAGIEVGKKMAMSALRRLSGRIFIEINKRVGFRLLTKFGEKGVINAGRAIPVLGGLIGSGVDAAWTKAIGNRARDIFTPECP
ncbi:MAG: EcsC family protein [Gemmatimonadetes bacterium]|nr:EcsC family protein [Gemmatimonadota bacterium]